MNYRFYNARILTMVTTDIMQGELWVQDDKILYVGKGGDAAAICQSLSIDSILWDREIDCGGNLLMPGFKNAHTHSAMTFLRSRADDMPLSKWLNEQVFPMEAKLDGEMIYHLTKLAVLEYLTSGITSIFDMYLTPETTAKACVEMGMRCVQVGAVSGQDHFEASLAKMEERYHTLNELDPLHSYFIGFHAEYTCSKALLEQVAAMAHQYQIPVFAHLSETKAEVDGCKERHGMSPVKLLDEIGMFDYGGGGYHCVWLDEEDMDIFAKRNLSAVTNPGSNTKLARVSETGNQCCHRHGRSGQQQLSRYVPGNVFSHRACQVKRAGRGGCGCAGSAENGNGKRCESDESAGCRCACDGETGGSYHDRSSSAQYAATQQYCKKSGLQRQ